MKNALHADYTAGHSVMHGKLWSERTDGETLGYQAQFRLALGPADDAEVFALGAFEVVEVLLKGGFVELEQKLRGGGRIVPADLIDELTFVHGRLTFRGATNGAQVNDNHGPGTATGAITVSSRSLAELERETDGPNNARNIGPPNGCDRFLSKYRSRRRSADAPP